MAPPTMTWLLRERGVACPILSKWADLSYLRQRPQGLQERIRQSLKKYPCDLLFVHRDAENESPERRRDEVREALASVGSETPPTVCVVPVRMMEAWLLFDEGAIRRVAGNPNGTMLLDLPRLNRTEDLPDPKKALHACLRTASGLHGARLTKFTPRGSARRIADRLDSFAPLRELAAFRALEAEIVCVVREQGWDRSV